MNKEIMTVDQINDLATDMSVEYYSMKEEGIKRYPAKSNQASQLAWPCLAYLKHLRVDWNQAREVSVGLAMRFEVGNQFEELVLNDLKKVCSRLNAKVLSTGQPFSDDKINISGRVDAIIRLENGQKIVVEIKSVSPYIFDDIATVEDLKQNVFTSKWFGQLQVYQYLSGLENGLMILKCLDGRVRFLGLQLDYEYAESLLKNAEKVNDAINGNTELPKINDNKYCSYCQFKGTACFPELKFGEGVKIKDDNELAEKLERRAELELQAKEFGRIDKECKSAIKNLEGLEHIIGNWQITKKESITTKYEIPSEIKNKYKTEGKSIRISFERIEK